MRAGAWLVCLLALTEGLDGFLQKNEGIKTDRKLHVGKNKQPVQEYEILLQVTYRSSEERRELEGILKDLKSPTSCLHMSTEIINVKATTYCGSQNGVLRCSCEDSYTWFPPSCLDPQNCHLHTTGPLPSCECRLYNLSQSVNFCERAKVWGTFKINKNFTKDLLNSSSAIYINYKTAIEHQLKTAYKGIQAFDSVRVTQFRPGSILAGYEVTGSSSTEELLAAMDQMLGKATAALSLLFPVEEGSFRVLGKVQCNSIFFGFGSEDDEYALLCSDGYVGSVTVRCWSSGWQVTRESCVLPQLEHLQQNFRVIVGNITEAEVSSLVQNLSVIIQQSPSTTVGNLASVVSILGNISSLSLANHFTVSNSTLADVISIADHILNSASVANWTRLLQEEKDASSRLLETLENISTLVPSTALPLNFSREFIHWNGIPVTQIQSTQGYNYHFEMIQKDTSSPIRGLVFIESEQFQRSHPQSIISMASLTFGNILPATKNGTAQVNGPVISTLIQNHSINELFLNFSKAEANLSQPQCVFWDFRHLQWSDAGCQLVNETPGTVLCRCTHLTSFSVLMSPSVPPEIAPVVKWITYVGLGISIASLVLCLVIESLFWKQTKKSQTSYARHVCMVNIALSLLIADVWFVVGATADATADPSGICMAAVFCTHFFYLALFFWMLSLGILLAYRLILVFHHMALPRVLASGFCLGYGCPLVIAAVTIAVTQPTKSYQRKSVCWLSWEGGKPLLAFVVPALTVVAVNWVVVLLVLRKLWRPAIGERLSQDDKATVLRVGKSLLILSPLLGLTWGVGVATMLDSQRVAWHVVFALLNAFQGFFIFCFGILLDTKLRQLLFNKFSPLSSWKQTSKQNSSDIFAKAQCLKSFNILQNKGTYTLSQTGDSANDITLIQFSSTE